MDHEGEEYDNRGEEITDVRKEYLLCFFCNFCNSFTFVIIFMDLDPSIAMKEKLPLPMKENNTTKPTIIIEDDPPTLRRLS